MNSLGIDWCNVGMPSAGEERRTEIVHLLNEIGQTKMRLRPALLCRSLTDPDVRQAAGAFLIFAALTPLIGAAAFAFDGIYMGATWTRAMRNLMLISLALYLCTFFVAQGWSNAGLWTAFLVFLGSRGIGQALLYPRLAREAFAKI